MSRVLICQYSLKSRKESMGNSNFSIKVYDILCVETSYLIFYFNNYKMFCNKGIFKTYIFLNYNMQNKCNA